MFKWWRERKAKKAAVAAAAAEERRRQDDAAHRLRIALAMRSEYPRSKPYQPYRVITKDSHHCAQTMSRRPDEPVATVPYEGTWSGFDMSSPSPEMPSVDTGSTADVGGGGDFGGGGASSDF